jgi:hypothetical protein
VKGLDGSPATEEISGFRVDDGVKEGLERLVNAMSAHTLGSVTLHLRSVGQVLDRFMQIG